MSDYTTTSGKKICKEASTVPRVRTTQSKDAPQRCRHPRPRRLGGRLRARPDGRRVSSRRIHGFTLHGFSCLPVHNAALCSRAYSNRKRVTNVCAGRCSSAPRRSARPRRRPPCAPPRFANRAILQADLIVFLSADRKASVSRSAGVPRVGAARWSEAKLSILVEYLALSGHTVTLFRSC